MFDMVDFQFINLWSALNHSGDNIPVDFYKQYIIEYADAIWKTKSDEENRKLYNYFLMDSKKQKHDNVITSTESDGLYSVVNQAKPKARKPMQRKRTKRTGKNTFIMIYCHEFVFIE